MKLPRLNHPELYQGLYVFDFGDRVAVGYTAEEIEMMLMKYRDGRAYKIHRATPQGELALRGRSHVDTSLEEAMLFFRDSAEKAAIKNETPMVDPYDFKRVRKIFLGIRDDIEQPGANNTPDHRGKPDISDISNRKLDFFCAPMQDAEPDEKSEREKHAIPVDWPLPQIKSDSIH